MSNVIDFTTRQSIQIGKIAHPQDDRHTAPYTIEIVPNGEDGFEWWLVSDDQDNPPCENCVAADLAAIALSLRPPPRTFFERLKALFTGD